MRSALRKPLDGWLLTAALALLMVAVDQGIDHHLLNNSALDKPPWSVLVVFVGMLLLNGRQEAVLVVLFEAMELSDGLAFDGGQMSAREAAMDGRRILALACCIWAAHLRHLLEQRHAALAASRQRLSEQLVQSLQASALAHELRQPLGQLLLQTRLLQHRLELEDTGASALEATLEQLHQSGEQINELLEAMTRLLRSDSGPPAHPAWVYLTALLEQSLERMQSELNAVGVTVQRQGLDQPAWLQGDPELLRIACTNLLRNAVQALQMRPRQERQLLLHLARQPHTLRLDVADSGPGLPENRSGQQWLTSTSPTGMGLGLLTTQTIARHHGGELILGRSPALGGAEVGIRFPLAAPPASADSGRAPPAAPARRR